MYADDDYDGKYLFYFIRFDLYFIKMIFQKIITTRTVWTPL